MQEEKLENGDFIGGEVGAVFVVRASSPPPLLNGSISYPYMKPLVYSLLFSVPSFLLWVAPVLVDQPISVGAASRAEQSGPNRSVEARSASDGHTANGRYS